MLHLYHDSELWIEWTNQHGCGSRLEGGEGKVVCQQVLHCLSIFGQQGDGSGALGCDLMKVDI